jgi:hypothetical protein
VFEVITIFDKKYFCCFFPFLVIKTLDPDLNPAFQENTDLYPDLDPINPDPQHCE